MRYSILINGSGTKRHQHRITAGALGDFLKRVLGMGYASWTSGDNPDEWFQDIQWLEPVTLRFNMQEHRVFVQVDRESSEITPIFEGPIQYDAVLTSQKLKLHSRFLWLGRGCIQACCMIWKSTTRFKS